MQHVTEYVDPAIGYELNEKTQGDRNYDLFQGQPKRSLPHNTKLLLEDICLMNKAGYIDIYNGAFIALKVSLMEKYLIQTV